MKMICPACGKENENDAKCCIECGTKLRESGKKGIVPGGKFLKFVLIIPFVALLGLLFATNRGCISHDYADATCTAPRTCVHCGKTLGEPAGHDWVEATCLLPKTCIKCAERSGEALGHDWTNSTCTTPGKCRICSTVQTIQVSHTPGIWTEKTQPTWMNAGCEELRCSMCNELIDSRSVNPIGMKVDGISFNFIPEEIVQWLRTLEIEITHIESWGTDEIYRIAYPSGSVGVLWLYLEPDVTGEKVCGIRAEFEDIWDSIRILLLVAETIDYDFSDGHGMEGLEPGYYYENAGMTITRLAREDGSEWAMLAPDIYFDYIMSQG